MDYYAIGYAFLAALFYAFFYFVTYKISDTNNIDWSLLGSTMLIGLVFGIIQALTGIVPTFEGTAAIIAEYWVIIAVLDQIIHQIQYRYFPEVKAQQMKIRKGIQE